MLKKKNTNTKLKHPVWRTKSGQVIRVCDMTDFHLVNAINFLKRSYISYHLKSLYNIEKMISGELASDMIDASINDFCENDPEDDDIAREYPIYKDLLDEALVRDIEI